MRLWVWRNLRIKLPDDWEMLQFSRRPATGSCAFADRYRYRLEFSWNMLSCKAGDGPPDIGRFMSDYRSKLTLEEKMPDARLIEVGAWRGIHGHVGEVLTTRFASYCSAESCILELVFVWPDGDKNQRDRRLEKSVLKTVKEEAVVRPAVGPDAGGYRRWRAFGMDLVASGGLELEECKVEAARSLLRFGDPADPARTEQFRRLGMTSHWLRVPVAEWLQQNVPGGPTVRSRTSEMVSGHRIESVRGDMPAKGFSRLMGRRDSVEAAAWICPADGRLYYVRIDAHASVGPSPDEAASAREGGGEAGLRLAGGRLSCCSDLSQML